MSKVMETVQSANLALGRETRKLNLHDASCAQCIEALTSDCDCKVCHGNVLEHRCDAALEMMQNILDYEDDARAARGEKRLQS